MSLKSTNPTKTNSWNKLRNHFNDIKNITTTEVQESIQEFIRSEPTATNKKKEKRKKKKKKDKG